MRLGSAGNTVIMSSIPIPPACTPGRIRPNRRGDCPAELPHHIAGVLSIDHIAIPNGWQGTARCIPAEADGARLSDRDVYVVDVVRP